MRGFDQGSTAYDLDADGTEGDSVSIRWSGAQDQDGIITIGLNHVRVTTTPCSKKLNFVWSKYGHVVRSFKRGSMRFPSLYSVFQEVLVSFVGSMREIKWSGNTRKRRERTLDVQLLYNVQTHV